MSDDIAKMTGRRAGELFADEGFFCAESVLLAVAEEWGFRSGLIPGIATGFCGGMSQSGGMCGALSGGILALNMVLGRNSARQSVENNYDAVRELITGFEKRFGATACPDLIGCDLETDEGQKYFAVNNCEEKCENFSRIAAGMVSSILEGSDPE